MERLPRLVETPAHLAEMVAELRQAPLVAVDTESNAFHAYRPRVCLIQVADRTREWAIDAKTLEDLTPLAELLNDPHQVKVLHAAEGDILALRRDFGWGITPVFDTMVAARLLGIRRYGLADLLAERFNVRLEKRFQRHDWGERPIPPAALRYAGADVRYLLPLHDILRERLEAEGRLEEAAEEFERVSRAVPEERGFDEQGFWRIKGARDLPPRGRAVLRELYLFRDERARAQDRPPFKLLSDDTLLAIAARAPLDLMALRRVGLTPLQVDRYGNGILAAVRRGLQAEPPQPPRGGPPPDPRIVARYEALREWRRRVAAARGVEPDVILPNAALRALAYVAPTTAAEVARVAGLGPWKTRAYAVELARILQEVA
jgi:ribonuclease D